MSKRDFYIPGGKGEEELATEYLELVSESLMRAKQTGSQMRLSASLFQRVLHELLRYRYEEARSSKEIEEIVSEMEADAFKLPVSESRMDPFDFSAIEILDLSEFGPADPSVVEEVDDLEAPEDIDTIVIAPPPVKSSLVQRQRRHRMPALHFYRILFFAFVGLFIFICVVLLGG